jgi:beta-glucanase (GH16 family)
MRAQIPATQGAWPGFWLLPYASPMTWPQNWEIDIAEIGFGGNSSLNPQIDYSLHYNSMAQVTTSGPQAMPALTSGFHIFALDWEPGSLTFYVDGTAEYTVTSNVPANAAYILVQYGIGDDNWSFVGVPTSASSTALANNQVPMKVDYIRVYQKSSSGCYATIPAYSTIPSTTCAPSDTAPPATPRGLRVQ